MRSTRPLHAPPGSARAAPRLVTPQAAEARRAQAVTRGDGCRGPSHARSARRRRLPVPLTHGGRAQASAAGRPRTREGRTQASAAGGLHAREGRAQAAAVRGPDAREAALPAALFHGCGLGGGGGPTLVVCLHRCGI